MSYNVTRIQVLKLDATMEAVDVLRLLRELQGDLPERCFLDDQLFQHAILVLEAGIAPGQARDMRLATFAWTGEGSGGRWWEMFKEKVAPHIRGLVEAIVTWEGGDHVSGLRIRDGVVTEPKVIMTLEEEAPR